MAATAWERRDAKWRWALNNPDKVRQANKNWRRAFPNRYNQATAARMRRYRQRLRITKGLPTSVVT
jgi:hypothetical protein